MSIHDRYPPSNCISGRKQFISGFVFCSVLLLNRHLKEEGKEGLHGVALIDKLSEPPAIFDISFSDILI